MKTILAFNVFLRADSPSAQIAATWLSGDVRGSLLLITATLPQNPRVASSSIQLRLNVKSTLAMPQCLIDEHQSLGRCWIRRCEASSIPCTMDRERLHDPFSKIFSVSKKTKAARERILDADFKKKQVNRTSI